MARDIFISYRRDDASGYALALYKKLREVFVNSELFIDIDTIELGRDFVEVIEDTLETCEVVLTLIGRNWIMPQDDGTRRIDNPNDYVRTEITKALSRNIRVIPIFLDGATMPSLSELPSDLSELVRRNGIEIRAAHFDSDVQRLVETLERIIKPEETADEHKKPVDTDSHLSIQSTGIKPKVRLKTMRFWLLKWIIWGPIVGAVAGAILGLIDDGKRFFTLELFATWVGGGAFWGLLGGIGAGAIFGFLVHYYSARDKT